VKGKNLSKVFKFGENWASYSEQATAEKVEEAIQSLVDLFGAGTLDGKSFLDIGCGSGLFAIAAARLGARPVLGIDADPVSIKTSRENAERWLDDAGQVSFSKASVLDGQRMASLGTFDIVYSWGVLHHTGNMKLAIEHAADSVKPAGRMMIAIYNRHWTSPVWKIIKWLYNSSGTVGQRVLTGMLSPVIFIAKWLVTGKDPRHMRRGMDFKHNIIDWVGGYPYEYASVEKIQNMLEGLGFQAIKIKPANVPTGCNEFIAQRS